MLAQLRLAIQSDPVLTYRKSSNLQGVLFEHMNEQYAARLHAQQLHPYSQYLHKAGCTDNLSGKITGKGIDIEAGVRTAPMEWVVNTLNQEAYEQILRPLISADFNAFELKDHTSVKVMSRTLLTMQDKDLVEEFNQAEGCRTLNIAFQSPTAFRQNGRYNILPEPRLIIQSLMNRYSASSPDLDMTDEETLEEICSHCYISRYRIHTITFPLEGTAIPGFVGTVSLHAGGSATLARYLHMLLHFGEFSGIGIKTGMGMGGIRLL